MTTEGERRADLHRAVGEAVHLAQTLELQLGALVAVVNKHFQTALDVEGLIVPDHRDTLGQLMRRLEAVGTVDNNGRRILRDALEKRNYITHHFFNRNTYAFSVDDVFHDTKEALRADTTLIAMGVALTQGWLYAFCEALNIDPNEILFRQDTR
jgi:hypothetical protein